MKIAFLLTPLLVGILVVAACGPASPTSAEGEEVASPSLVVTIDIDNFTFNPQSITVKKGTTIRWNQLEWVRHRLISSSPGAEFDSGNLHQGETFDYTFTVVGTYEYSCQTHPYFPSETGKIIVVK